MRLISTFSCFLYPEISYELINTINDLSNMIHNQSNGIEYLIKKINKWVVKGITLKIYKDDE